MVDATIPNAIKPTVTKRTSPKAPAPKVPAAPATATKTISIGGIAFELELDAEIPPEALLAPGRTANPLPFRALFTEMTHGVHHFVPTTFWTERGIKADLVKKPAYLRGKIREQFKLWQAEKPTERANHGILLLNRAVGSTDHRGKTYPEGISIFMQVTVPKG